VRSAAPAGAVFVLADALFFSQRRRIVDAKPTDRPVEPPTKFELVINLQESKIYK
jgi:hypothetical protein